MNIFKNKILRQVMLLMGGSAGAQLLSFMSSPIITRLFDPADFGIFGTYNSVLLILTPLIALSYPMSIVVQEDNYKTILMAKVCIYLSMLTSAILFLLMSAFFVVQNNFEIEVGFRINFEYLLIPAGMFLTILIQVLSFYLIRHHEFKLKVILTFLQALIVSILKLIFGYFYPTALSLIISFLLASLLSFIVVYRFINVKFSIKFSNDLNAIKLILKENIEYPKFRMPQGVISALNQSAPVLALWHIYGVEAAGFFTLCRSVLLMPLNLVAQSVNDVLFPNMTKYIRENDYTLAKKTYLVSLFIMIIVALPIVIILMKYSPNIFGLVFGQNWEKSGVYATFYSAFLFFNFINRPALATIPALKLEKNLLINSALTFFLIVTGFITCYLFDFDDSLSVSIYSYTIVIPQIYILFIVLINLRRR